MQISATNGSFYSLVAICIVAKGTVAKGTGAKIKGRENGIRRTLKGKKEIESFLNKKRASILIVYGRRRVGKTALIEKSLSKSRTIKIEGKQNQKQEAQIAHALSVLAKEFKDPLLKKLNFVSWEEVFNLIADRTQKGQWVLYLEELQWLSCYEDTLISDLKEVWDNQFSKNSDFRLILCGSSPSFMITHVLKSKALYNRSQYTLPLKQFSVEETNQYFGGKKSLIEVMDAYLSVGGIPEYLAYLTEESSVYLSLIKNSFRDGAFFLEEYEKIFTSSLSDNKHYRKILSFLAKKRYAHREEILDEIGASSGGNISFVFDDLEACGFIQKIMPFDSQEGGSRGGSRLVRYCISDNYLQFYDRFIAPHREKLKTSNIKYPHKFLPIEDYRKWLGYAFERWCRLEHQSIASKLGFSDVEYSAGAYFARRDLKTQFQIDLVYQRKDRVLTVCEIKYNSQPITASIVSEFETKLMKIPKTKNQTIQRVLIAAGGANPQLKNHFDRILTLEDLVTF